MSLLWRAAQRTERVPGEDLPTHPEPNGISDEDHPRDYQLPHLIGTYSLKTVPLKDLHDHEHNANCYLPTEENQRKHDVADDEYEGEHYDHKYVKEMARHVDDLPLLVGYHDQDEEGHPLRYWGGGHRSAAHAEAGRTHIKMWVKDT